MVFKSRKKNPILFNEVNFVPGLHCNLLSLSKAMKVFKLSGKDDQLKLKFKSLEYCFDHKTKSKSGILFGLKILTGKGDKYVLQKRAHAPNSYK